MCHEEFEKNILSLLLGERTRVEYMQSLWNQYVSSDVKSREFTGCGFFTKYIISDTDIKYPLLNGRIDDVKAFFPDGRIYYFILYIINGKIDGLEGFSLLGDWCQDYENATLCYCYENRREYDLKFL